MLQPSFHGHQTLTLHRHGHNEILAEDKTTQNLHWEWPRYCDCDTRANGPAGSDHSNKLAANRQHDTQRQNKRNKKQLAVNRTTYENDNIAASPKFAVNYFTDFRLRRRRSNSQAILMADTKSLIVPSAAPSYIRTIKYTRRETGLMKIYEACRCYKSIWRPT